jgi:signal transduction histidine kinase
MNFRLSNYLSAVLISFLTAQVIPTLFIYLDLIQLGLPWSIQNARDVYKSQLIYVVSSISMPVLIFTFYMQFKRIASQKIFLNQILDGMTEQIVVFDHYLNPSFKNKAHSKSSLPFKLDALFQFIDRTDPFEWTHEEGNSLRTFICSFSKLLNKSGTLLIIQEITESKRKDELLKTQEVNLVSSSRLASLGEMAAGIAHEINNPLSVIIGRSTMIQSQMADGSATEADISKALTKINDMAERISKIIISMRKVSKADVGVMDSTKLVVAVEDVLNLSAEKIKLSSIDVDVSELHSETIVQINYSQFSQVLINLITNSIDELQMQPEGKKKIWIHDEEDEGDVILKIRDSGPGIPKETREKLFQPFFTTKEVGKGTGLGLSISKNLMNGMGGDLVLSPDLTQTCFVLKLKKG